jgi:hypothetical protein
MATLQRFETDWQFRCDVKYLDALCFVNFESLTQCSSSIKKSNDGSIDNRVAFDKHCSTEDVVVRLHVVSLHSRCKCDCTARLTAVLVLLKHAVEDGLGLIQILNFVLQLLA